MTANKPVLILLLLGCISSIQIKSNPCIFRFPDQSGKILSSRIGKDYPKIKASDDPLHVFKFRGGPDTPNFKDCNVKNKKDI